MTTKILFIGHYPQNKGDQGILQGSITQIKKIIPDAEFVVSSLYPKLTNKTSLLDIIDWILPVRNVEKTGLLLTYFQSMIDALLIIMWVIFSKNHNTNFFLFTTKQKKILQMYLTADIIVSIGGHHFTNLNPPHYFFTHLFSCLVAKLLGKKVVIYGQTIGPFFNPFWKYFSGWVINKVDLIMVREEGSRRVLETLNLENPEIYTIPDTAFNLYPAKEERINQILEKEKIPNNTQIVGITIHKGYWSSKEIHIRENYMRCISKIADFIIETYNEDVIFVPMEREYPNDDRPLCKCIIQTMSNQKRAHLIMGDYMPDEICGIMNKMDFFIGTKMHSIIFSLLAKTPTIAISYHEKFQYIMAMMRQEKYVLNINNLNFNDLKYIVQDIWNNQLIIRNDLVFANKLLESNSSKAGAMICKLATPCEYR